MPATCVSDLPLPSTLVELITARRWKPPADVRLVTELTGIKDAARLEYLKLERMALETESLANLFRQGFGDIYGLAQSEDGGEAIADHSLLDVRLAVSIAVNFDEEGLCLDYRPGFDKPRVVAGTWAGDKPPMAWTVIAPDLDTLVSHLSQ